MGVWIADKHRKPAPWGLDPGLVAPEWRWFWNICDRAWLKWSGEDLLREFVVGDNGTYGSVVSTVNGTTGWRSRHGAATGTTGAIATGYRMPARTEYSVLWRGRLNDYSISHRAFLAGQVSSSTNGYDWGGPYFSTPATGTFFFYPKNGSTLESTSTFATNDEFVFVGVYRSGVTNGTELWVDGVREATASITGASGSAYDFALGTGWNSTARVQADTDCCYILNRALTAAEARRISDDVFGPFRMADDVAAWLVPPPPSGLTIPVAAYHYNHHLGSMN